MSVEFTFEKKKYLKKLNVYISLWRYTDIYKSMTEKMKTYIVFKEKKEERGERDMPTNKPSYY